MSMLVAVVRRSLWVLLLAAAGGAAYAWWRDRDGDDGLAPPEWPPLEPVSATTGRTASSGGPDVGSAEPADTSTAGAAGSSTARTASVVNSLVDAPEARSTDGGAGGWVTPDDDGACPISHPIKANDNSGIFHVPDGRFYERTRAERCYADPDAARADGYRQAKH